MHRGVEILRRRGFKVVSGEFDEGACLVKGGRRAVFLEIASYGGLLFALGFGMVNYGLGLYGYLQVSPHGESMDFVKNLRVVQKGFLVDMAGFDLKLSCDDLTDGGPNVASKLTLRIADGRGRVIATPQISTGERFDAGGFQAKYSGDAYLLSSYITVKTLDLRSLPTFLYSRWGGREGVYRGALRLADPGATGVAEFDPATGKFRFVVTTKEGLQGGQSLRMGETGHDGDFSFTVSSYGHMGKVEIWHHYYRNQIFGGLALMLIALLARLILRPQQVWFWAEGGANFFFTRNRSVRKEIDASDKS